ncbi:hypothetical protein [Vibrio sp. HA2012]|uniref:hypothetical protein n=1 Tax=Vibrio sp. HA2012 TaxID=1971595 RepID=UPI0012FD3E35|nr:hypothetical protein [Vibrio sp. HA2012]
MLHPVVAQEMLSLPEGGRQLPTSVSAEKSPEQVVEEESSWIDITENYFATTVHDFSNYIDQGLGKREGDEALKNRSYIRLRSLSDYSRYGDFNSDARVSLRIDMPYTERRWNLIFDTDPDDYQSLESKQRDLPTKNVDADAIGGVRYQDGWLDDWDTDLDIGLKLRWPLDPFVRTEFRRVEVFDSDWVGAFRQQFFYYHSVGGGSLSELKFYYPVTEDEADIFSVGPSAQYLFDEERWELLLQMTLSDRVDNDHLLEYSAGLSVDPDESDKVTNYWVSVAWHLNVYKNWLYVSVTPRIDAPREYDYQINPGIRLDFEMFFSKNRKINRLNRSIPRSTRNSGGER